MRVCYFYLQFYDSNTMQLDAKAIMDDATNEYKCHDK